MAGLGMRAQDIAYILDLDVNVIVRDYGDAMLAGVSKANYRVANSLFMIATTPTHKSQATAAIYWTKARMGWAETAAKSAEDVPEGGSAAADASHLTDDSVKDRFAETMSALRNAG